MGNHLIDQFEGVINMKKKNKKIINNKIRDLLLNQKGMALLTTLIFVFILVTFAVALLIMTSNDTKLSALQRDSTKAFYIAEAGVERTLYNLKKDFESNQDWSNDNSINGYNLSTEDTNGFRKIEYDTDSTVYVVSFGDGEYTVSLKINNSNNVTIKSKGVAYNKSTRYVQVDATIGSLSIWDNAIFAGSGASGKVINGNVDIRGSVHLLGEGLAIGDPAVEAAEIGGTAGIGNNYIGMNTDLRGRIKDPPHTTFNGEDVETLNAKLYVKQGKVNISGTATIGDPDVHGDTYKETLDGVYVTEGFGGNKGVENVYSDNGTDQPYGFVEGTFEFPDLMNDAYIDVETGDTVVIPGSDPEQLYTYVGYYDSPNVLHITDTDEVVKVSLITSETESFNIPSDAPDNHDNYIIWNQATGALTISGIIVIDVDVSIGDKPNDPSGYKYEYTGRGTIVSKGDISIHGDLLAHGVKTFPETYVLGLIAYNDLYFATGIGDSQLEMSGAFFAQNNITSKKQNEIAGTFVSNYCDMGANVPKIFQVPGLENNLPPGMPGAAITYSLHTSNWHEVHE